MTNDTKVRLSDILDRVKDPQNGVSISQMNLVAGIKQHEEANEFIVYFNAIASAKACCVIFQLSTFSTMETLLKVEIEKEFAGSKVLFANA